MLNALARALAVALLAAAALIPQGSQAADKINVLIIDGQNNHGWKATTPVIKEMLLKTGRFNVDVLTSPDKAPSDKAEKGKPAPDPQQIAEAKKKLKEEWAKFRPDFSKYQVVFSNYNGENWPDEVNKAFEKYMQDGGGLVVYHAANNAFTGWAEWAKMVGLLWSGPQYGERITLDENGKEVRTPKGEGPGAGHGPQHPYEVVVRDPENPITKGLPAKWIHAKDELYQAQRGPAQNMHILVTAFADPAMKGTGTNEPMVWTIPCGKGRVFVNLLGHDQTSVAAPGCV
ncbi:MAG: ThuA domain-containing protein, partial [Candidatus Sumerlaeota bacterium]|nr:ThuA domain-containing protein [Candidatus Sumerlaeota bacterium]